MLSALLLAAGVTVIGTSLAHSASAPRPPGGWAVPSNVGLGGWTETWSTGSLSDGNQPIALSSPTVADLGGQPSVVVGDRRGLVYAYHLATPSGPGSPPTPTSVAGWPTTNLSGPVDSPPSVVTLPGGQPEVLVGSGNDADPTSGGYSA